MQGPNPERLLLYLAGKENVFPFHFSDFLRSTNFAFARLPAWFSICRHAVRKLDYEHEDQPGLLQSTFIFLVIWNHLNIHKLFICMPGSQNIFVQKEPGVSCVVRAEITRGGSRHLLREGHIRKR